ncbi:hypothetical protein SAMN05443665_101258 [Actinomadura meyerae]|uniref:Uncharacterized protein n=2 Tax=Actinomadura meyerae TaxID=240840 RepID=A0A239IBX8_9ACTN|nr:hypothetical protein SAMN05443665_101258 [Actinomadura meyerae]
MGLSLVPGDTTGKDRPELALQCAAEKETVLGTVRVRPGSETTAPGMPSVSPRQAAASQGGLCQVIPGRGEDPRYAVNENDPKLMEIYHSPDTPKSLRPVPAEGEMYCVKATGFFNVKKAGNAVPVAFENNVRALTTVAMGNGLFGPNWQDARGYFINRTYRTPATVLGFGFMPTRAVAEAVQVGAPGDEGNGPITGNLRILQRLSLELALPDPTVDRQQIRASAYIRVKAGQADVNGVPLDLGDKCMTSPTALSATGFMGNVQTGMTQYDSGQTLIAKEVNIPSFSGCGVTEDLSPILTASVSGSGNYANLESGIWCVVTDGTGCVNDEGAFPQTFSVDTDGVVTAVAKPFTLGRGKAEFRCESATMRLKMERGHWQSRFRLAKGGMSLAGCTVKASDDTVYQIGDEVTQDGSLWLNMTVDPKSGKPVMNFNGVLLNIPMDVAGKKCALRIGNTLQRYIPPGYVERPGMLMGSYENGTFAMSDHTLRPSPGTTCRIPGYTVNSVFTSFKGDFAFEPAPRITTP